MFSIPMIDVLKVTLICLSGGNLLSLAGVYTAAGFDEKHPRLSAAGQVVAILGSAAIGLGSVLLLGWALAV